MCLHGLRAAACEAQRTPSNGTAKSASFVNGNSQCNFQWWYGCTIWEKLIYRTPLVVYKIQCTMFVKYSTHIVHLFDFSDGIKKELYSVSLKMLLMKCKYTIQQKDSQTP